MSLLEHEVLPMDVPALRRLLQGPLEDQLAACRPHLQQIGSRGRPPLHIFQWLIKLLRSLDQNRAKPGLLVVRTWVIKLIQWLIQVYGEPQLVDIFLSRVELWFLKLIDLFLVPDIFLTLVNRVHFYARKVVIRNCLRHLIIGRLQSDLVWF